MTSGLKLPRVDIPTFEGNFEQWSGWHKLFESLIHKNDELDDMGKFSFLRSRLKGVPLTLIDAFPFESEFYVAAYSTVVSHYNDPLKRVSRLLDTIAQASSMKDKRQSLRGLITLYRATATALQITFNQNRDIDPVSQLLIHSFLDKADKGTRQDWEREMTRKKKFANFSEFIEYMEGRCNAYERAIAGSSSQSNAVQHGRSTAKVLTTVARTPRCYCCNQGHTIYKCPQFRALTIADRKKMVADKNLCHKCLSPRCNRKCSINCGKCKRGHNLLLHESTVASTSTSTHTGNEMSNLVSCVDNTVSNNETIYWLGHASCSNSEVLLATAQLRVYNFDKTVTYFCRAILDSASQINVATVNLLEKLKLTPQMSSIKLQSFDGLNSSSQGIVTLQLLASNSNFNLVATCEVIDEIVDLVPSSTFTITDWKFPKNINLADPRFNVSSKIDLLLGARIFWKILGNKIINLGKNLPCLRSSHLGWVVTDARESERSSCANSKRMLVTQIRNNLAETIQQFWFLDEFDSTTLSFEESECERIYVETTRRTPQGRFVVRLPFKIPPHKLGHSRTQTFKRFTNLEKRFKRDPVFYKNYITCMEDYISAGHMQEITENLEQTSYYIPHHAVIKESSSSTKLRAVFDASMATSNGLSLNQCLMVGPVIQSDLISLIMRFRVHKVVFSADIVKMYRQVQIHPEDARFQRIFWRSNFEQKIKVFEIKTLAFGTSSAPYLATRCLKALADDDGKKFPASQSVLLKDFYVDDVLTGGNTIDKALEIQQQLIEILAGAGFKLSKWCSNVPELLLNIPENEREKTFSFNLNKGSNININDKVIKTLGLLWYPTTDSFQIKVQIENYSFANTKRQILSIVASIFDPLGLIGPITVVAKLIIQSLWSSAQAPCSPKSKEHWEENISQSLRQQWIDFASKLESLNNLSIPRYLFNHCRSIRRIEIHGFSDASEKAYGTAIYIRAIGSNEFSSRLIFSKSRVAPLKHQSLPRLELCAALLLSESINKVILAVKDLLKIDVTRLWCDSQIVLHWINSPSNRWLPFVANRVQKIQNLTNDYFWDYVESKNNPADLISRGATPNELKNSELWWKGPKWLLNEECFNSEVKFALSKKPLDIEFRKAKRVLTFVAVMKSSIFQLASNYWKLVRIVATVSRFFWNAHWYGPKITGPLQIFELRDAVRTLVKLSQKECFPIEIKKLNSGLDIDKSSPLSSFSPFLDHHSIIRVGGRLQNSELSFDQQHPFVLDPTHEFTKLIIRYYHESYFHAGPQLLKSILRNHFWILRINSAIRHCITRCHKCIRMKANSRTQMMAALPKSRVTPSKPFSITGIDYAGPFSILGKGGRHKVLVKAYIAVFVCFCTKAIHLELVSDLTSEAFLAAFTRFISRRGIPTEVHSDNGTNFVGAKNLLKRQFLEFMASNFDEFSKFASHKGCQWHFIPPHAPHFGGLWEAGVKSVKAHLRYVFSKNTFTFEQWATLLAQVEACLNSRPLISESNDPNEFSALTPGHFLIGGPIIAIPNPDLTDVPINRLKYWDLVKASSQRFWKRWSREYLNTLQQRSKWRFKKDAVKVNDLVIIREENTAPATWPLGRIKNVHTGSDGLTRVVTVRTAFGQITRPIVKIIHLPIDEEDS